MLEVCVFMNACTHFYDTIMVLTIDVDLDFYRVGLAQIDFLAQCGFCRGAQPQVRYAASDMMFI